MSKWPSDDEALRQRLLKFLDGTLTAAERRTLERLLVDDAQARDVLRELALHAVVIADCERVTNASPPMSGSLPAVEDHRSAALAAPPASSWSVLPWTLAATAICACIVLGWYVAGFGRSGTAPGLPSREQPVRLAEVRFAQDAHLIAQQTPEHALEEGQRLPRGTYLLESGFVELDFFSGVVLAVESPATLQLISQHEARLLEGRVSVEAGDAETSFVLHTPVGEVIDIGTRYGVYVAGDGATETHVFEGLVDIHSSASRRAVKRVEAATAVRVSASGAMASVPATEKVFPQPSREIANLLLDGDFEADTELLATDAEDVGVWSGDVCRIVGPGQQVQPYSGAAMLMFQSTGKDTQQAAPTVASQLSQWIDLSPYRDAISAGRVRAVVSARFNRIAGNERTDSQFGIHLESFDVSPRQAQRRLQSQPAPPRSRVSYQLLSDDNPGSWERAEAVLTLPNDARFLQVTILAFENVSNDVGERPEFDGHFADDLRFHLDVDPAPGDKP